MKVFKFAMICAVAGTLSVALSACDSDDSSTPANNDNQQSAVDYSNKVYGQQAMSACEEVINCLNQAMSAIEKSDLTEGQRAELQQILENNVDNVIVPTYKNLADAAEKLQKALGDLSANEITQQNIDDACTAFKEARAWWGKSEAFLGGAASDFEIDPSIDSWPLNRDLLHSYFKTGEYSEEALDDQSIMGFHALEFVLFRNGKNRTVAEFQANDTYKGFSDVKGAEELKYAEDVAKELVLSCYNLEVAWSETPNVARLQAIQNDNRNYLTKKDKSFGWNMKNAGKVESTFDGLNDALAQVLNDDEGSATAIADEVGSGKIGHPFQSGYIFYVESPYSYNSLTDFQNNIRSIENVWFGNTNGASGNANVSFSKWFAKNDSKTGKAVEAAISNAISKIGAMPSPFVTYVSTIWGVSFEDSKVVDIPE